MEVTTGQIIRMYFVMVFVGLSGIIGAIPVFFNKGGDWEGKDE